MSGLLRKDCSIFMGSMYNFGGIWAQVERWRRTLRAEYANIIFNYSGLYKYYICYNKLVFNYLYINGACKLSGTMVRGAVALIYIKKSPKEIIP